MCHVPTLGWHREQCPLGAARTRTACTAEPVGWDWPGAQRSHEITCGDAGVTPGVCMVTGVAAAHDGCDVTLVPTRPGCHLLQGRQLLSSDSTVRATQGESPCRLRQGCPLPSTRPCGVCKPPAPHGCPEWVPAVCRWDQFFPPPKRHFPQRHRPPLHGARC